MPGRARPCATSPGATSATDALRSHILGPLACSDDQPVSTNNMRADLFRILAISPGTELHLWADASMPCGRVAKIASPAQSIDVDVTTDACDKLAPTQHLSSQTFRMRAGTSLHQQIAEDLLRNLRSGDLSPGSWRLERVRVTQQRPDTLQTSFIRVALCADLNRRDLKSQHAIQVMCQTSGIHLASAAEYLEPAVSDGDVAKHLSVPLQAPVFRIEQTAYTADGRVAEYRNAMLRGDTHRYRVELR
jgi:hypothetical protein